MKYDDIHDEHINEPYDLSDQFDLSLSVTVNQLPLLLMVVVPQQTRHFLDTVPDLYMESKGIQKLVSIFAESRDKILIRPIKNRKLIMFHFFYITVIQQQN